ncbi:MAG TPA: VWA domain-containing protein [Solirubrobacteraceae bacterium]|nr:VWA domain-containing protein [Solirubrobacteraceae bacterium]
MTSFATDVYQNEFLPAGGTEVSAIVTVAASGGGGHGPSRPPAAAEIVIVDTSGSMDVPRTKINAAREATSVAIDCIRDGVAFGVIEGWEEAHVLYPDHGLVPASEQTRRAAKEAVARLKAGGGTAIGTWLAAAGELFADQADAVCHAILLTDGANEHETREQLDAVLADCEGRFQCDCRGVGTDWEVSELRRISSVLLGTVELIRDPSEMAADFRAMIETAMARMTQSVSLRLWTPQGAKVKFVRQVAPTIEELTERASAVNPLTADYPTGSWGEESRDYHVCIEVPPRGLGEEMLAGRVSLVEGDEVLGQGLIKATWTDDERLSTRINREVAHYTGQAELAECIQDGLEARKSGDEAAATSKLGRAVRLASESGNDGTLKLLSAVVDIDDPATGTVRLRRDVADVDEMALDTRSTKTVRVGPAA